MVVNSKLFAKQYSQSYIMICNTSIILPEAKQNGCHIAPIDLTITNNEFATVISYSILFVIAAIGNMTVFITLCRTKYKKSRISLMIMHLTIADLVVTFIMIPMEIGWRVTLIWTAGDIGCRIMSFLRAFGLYLSSFVLVCISMDRYYAILHPLKVNDAHKRGKLMLLFAWILSIACSIPQSVIFHVEYHPVAGYSQCVAFNFFPTSTYEDAYNIFFMLAVYGLPLLIIILAYSRILIKLVKKSKETKEQNSNTRKEYKQKHFKLRRSGVSTIERARIRTLKMTVTIVMAFILCWTPYFVMTMWYVIDRSSAALVNSGLQSALFIFAASNSCINPLVYGTYGVNFKKEFRKCFYWQQRVFKPQHRRTISSGTDTKSGILCTFDENCLVKSRLANGIQLSLNNKHARFH